MTPLQLWITVTILALWTLRTQADQYVMQEELNEGEGTRRTPKRIAIIGAGVAGASTAYYLHEQTRLFNPVEITIFERSSRVGGRVKSAHVYGNPQDDIETGGATFSKDDWCLNKAMQEVGLKANPTNSRLTKNLGVWNGDEFVYTERESSYHWWNVLKLVWQYGRWPLRMKCLVEKTVKSFHELATVSYQPFTSLDEETKRLGLKAALEDNAETYLKREVVTEYEGWRYIREIIQANGRARYAQNLEDLHGLASIISMSSEGTQSVEGGNWRLLDRLIRISEAELHLNTAVTQIARIQDGSYKVSYDSASHKSGKTHDSAIFDNVILAAPFHHTAIKITPPLENPPLEIPFVARHVAYFTSPKKIIGGEFGFVTNNTIPEDVVTTLSYPWGKSPGFYSLTLPKRVYYLDGCLAVTEYLYKLVSSDPISETTISQLLNPTRNLTNSSSSSSFKSPDSDNAPLWIHHETWPHAYPRFPARVTFDEIELAPGLFYTGAGENLISSMEMSCLMGYNIGGIIYWRGYYDGAVETVP